MRVEQHAVNTKLLHQFFCGDKTLSQVCKVVYSFSGYRIFVMSSERENKFDDNKPKR